MQLTCIVHGLMLNAKVIANSNFLWSRTCIGKIELQLTYALSYLDLMRAIMKLVFWNPPTYFRIKYLSALIWIMIQIEFTMINAARHHPRYRQRITAGLFHFCLYIWYHIMIPLDIFVRFIDITTMSTHEADMGQYCTLYMSTHVTDI